MSEEKPPEPPSTPPQPGEKKSGRKGCVIAMLLGLAGLIFLVAGGVEEALQNGLWVSFGVIGIAVVLVTTPGYKPRETPSQGCLLAMLLSFAGLIFFCVLGVLGEVGEDWPVFTAVIYLLLLHTVVGPILLMLVVVIGWVYFRRKLRNRRKSAHDEHLKSKGEEVESEDETDD